MMNKFILPKKTDLTKSLTINATSYTQERPSLTISNSKLTRNVVDTQCSYISSLDLRVRGNQDLTKVTGPVISA